MPNYLIYLLLFVIFLYILNFLVDRIKPRKSSKSLDDWTAKVNSAQLNEEQFNRASLEKKQDLLYYFTQKIRIKDNYGDSSFKKMPKTLKVVYLINELEAEVNNGGFIQFFTNSSGKYTTETVESLELIQAPYTKSLVEDAIEIINKHGQTTNSLSDKIKKLELHEIMQTSDIYENEQLLNDMNEVNSKFYEYEESLSQLKLEYFEKNQSGLWKEIKEKYGS
jgi:hypothetical protein